jgi:hypothetical protein
VCFLIFHRLTRKHLALLVDVVSGCITFSEAHIRESRWLKSMYTLQGKSDQHATCISCSVHVWSHTIHISCGQHIATFHESPTDLDGSHYSREKEIPDYTLNTSADQSVVVGLSQASVDNRLLGLPGPYLQHAIGMFNTCSRGPTHRSLTDTGAGYNFGGVGFPHHTPQRSQPTVLCFPPKGLARSHVIHQIITIWTKGWSCPKSHEWKPPLNFYYNLSSKNRMS